MRLTVSNIRQKIDFLTKNKKFYLLRLLRKIDHKITLFILQSLKKFFNRKSSSIVGSKNIVCFIMENLGDTVRTSGVVNFLNSRFKSHFVCTKYNKDVLNLILKKTDNLITLNREPGLLDFIHFFKKKIFHKWDTAVILDHTSVKNFGISASIVSGISRVIFHDYIQDEYNAFKLISEKVQTDILTIAKSLILSEYFNFCNEKRIYLSENSEYLIFKDYIGIHVGGFGSILYPVSRKYPEEYTFKLIDSLLHRGLKVLITGDEIDGKCFRKFSEELSKYSDYIDLTGKLTISELAYLLRNIRIYITPDNGTLHLAQAVGCKDIIALLGPTSPYLVRGLNTTILRVNLPCSPCLKFLNFPKKCVNPVDHQCLWDLKPEMVLDEVLKKLQAWEA